MALVHQFFWILMIIYLNVKNEMFSVSKAFDKEEPPRHRVRALTNKLRRGTR